MKKITPKAKESLTVQKKGRHMTAWLAEDKRIWNMYPDNILLRITISSRKKQRSLKQHGLFRACLAVVADHCSETFKGDKVATDKEWNTDSKVLHQACYAIGWYSVVCVTPDGTVRTERKSTSFEAMEHPDACNVYSNAMDIISGKIGYTIEQLVEEAQSRMG